ncbi:MAG: hypothetical protein WCJ39_09300 [bacterium]
MNSREAVSFDDVQKYFGSSFFDRNEIPRNEKFYLRKSSVSPRAHHCLCTASGEILATFAKKKSFSPK